MNFIDKNNPGYPFDKDRYNKKMLIVIKSSGGACGKNFFCNKIKNNMNNCIIFDFDSFLDEIKCVNIEDNFYKYFDNLYNNYIFNTIILCGFYMLDDSVLYKLEKKYNLDLQILFKITNIHDVIDNVVERLKICKKYNKKMNFVINLKHRKDLDIKYLNQKLFEFKKILNISDEFILSLCNYLVDIIKHNQTLKKDEDFIIL